MYGKIFKQIYDGSLYGHWQAMVTLQQMIVLADRDGFVDMTPQALSARTGIPFEIIQQGLAELEQPDPASRTAEDEGRRIVRVSDTRTWGWHITNYTHFRKLYREEERREYKRQWMRDKRGQEKSTTSTSGQCGPMGEGEGEGEELKEQVDPSGSTSAAAGGSTVKRERRTRPRKTPPPEPRPATWLTPYADDWTARYGGPPPFGQLAKLRPAEIALGPEVARQAWRTYLVRTEAQFVNIPKFVSTIGVYSGSKPTLTGAERLTTEERSRIALANWVPEPRANGGHP